MESVDGRENLRDHFFCALYPERPDDGFQLAIYFAVPVNYVPINLHTLIAGAAVFHLQRRHNALFNKISPAHTTYPVHKLGRNQV